MNQITQNRVAKLEARTAALIGAVASGELTPLHAEDLDTRLTLLEAKL